jgi:hypothetical protein
VKSCTKWIVALCLGVAPLSAFAGSGDADAPSTPDRVSVRPPAEAQLQPSYKITAGIDGEIFPVFANYASMQRPKERKWGVVAVTITNPTSQALRERIAVSVPGWSDTELQLTDVASGESKTFVFSPTFLERFYANKEIKAATAEVTVSDGLGREMYRNTVPVRLRSADDIYWGNKFQYAPFIASWITPHDVNVEKILKTAKEFMPGRRLPGYEDWKNQAQQEKSTMLQAKAVYDAIKQQGVSYVKSSMTFGQNTDVSERVRQPRESLEQSSANCIDGAVVFASAFENLAMDPIVVLVPGHAYVGVRIAQGSARYLFVDTALTGRATFETAVKAAEVGLAKYGPSQITRIPVDEARAAGIFPMP